MPFTDPWSDIVPDDSTLADLLGADLRQLRLDIHDRMNVLFIDWTADPLTFQPTVIGQRNSIQIIEPYSELLQQATVDDVDGHAVLVNGASYTLPVRIPIGCTIRRLEILANVNAGTLFASLFKRPFGGAIGGANILECDNAGPGLQIAISGVIADLVTNANYYWIHLLHNAASCNFHAARITFDRDTNDHST